MDLVLNRRRFPVILLGVLIFLSIWWIRSMTDGLLATHSVLAIRPLDRIEEIVQQVLEENQSNSSSGGKPNRPNLRDEIEQAKSRISKNDYKAAKSNYQRMVEHVKKLEKYKENPLKFDNQGLLKNAPNDQIRQKIIESRVAHLEQEIQTFYNNIVKIINH